LDLNEKTIKELTFYGTIAGFFVAAIILSAVYFAVHYSIVSSDTNRELDEVILKIGPSSSIDTDDGELKALQKQQAELKHRKDDLVFSTSLISFYVFAFLAFIPALLYALVYFTPKKQSAHAE